MRIPIYQIDAFTTEQFNGNPAAVCPLEEWISDELMQKIAFENNLSETAFFVKNAMGYDLRWFTPKEEIDLCGHATLATAYVIFNYLDRSLSKVAFNTESGILQVTKEEELLAMTFPTRAGVECKIPTELIKGLGSSPKELYKSRDYMAVFETEDEIKNMKLNMEELIKLDAFGIIVTAKGQTVDFVSRYFAPGNGIMEDPVTGSSHCTLVPYWSKVLGKKELVAYQLSPRGGELFCTDLGTNIKISGRAVAYLEGSIIV